MEYSSMMWAFVAVLGLTLSFFAVQYFRSSGRIRKAKKDLMEVQEEFDQHRNTLERERKLKCKLIYAQMGKSNFSFFLYENQLKAIVMLHISVEINKNRLENFFGFFHGCLILAR